MSTPTEADMYDMFIDWLEKPYMEYKREEIESLWNEFKDTYPEGVDSWEFVEGE